jgi:hypothetical protein
MGDRLQAPSSLVSGWDVDDVAFPDLPAPEDAAGGIDWDVSVDSTIVWVHQHAAGARKAPAAASASNRRGTGMQKGVNLGLEALLVRLRLG